MRSAVCTATKYYTLPVIELCLLQHVPRYFMAYLKGPLSNI